MTFIGRITAPASSAEVSCTGPRVLEFKMYGQVSRSILNDVLAQAADLLRNHPEMDTTVWDFSEYTGYEPGTTAVAIRWSREHLKRFTHSVVITRSHVVRGLARVGQLMIPWIKVEVVACREDVSAVLQEIHRVGGRSAA